MPRVGFGATRVAVSCATEVNVTADTAVPVHAMQAYKGSRGAHPQILAPAPDRGEWSASHPDRSTLADGLPVHIDYENGWDQSPLDRQDGALQYTQQAT